mmetsp:Transcript_13722/g.32510  ORF Transcript_13722/g.32510 Transcript_13722/m.32510 type:complete len:263 (-) Transcript_13722:315-1103(-)
MPAFIYTVSTIPAHRVYLRKKKQFSSSTMSESFGAALESLRSFFGPGRVLVGIAAAGVALGAFTVGRRLLSAKMYWEETRASVVLSPGVKCGSWARKGVAEWFRINDIIMGGTSTSEISSNGAGQLVLTGNIVTTGGGFAAVRTTENCPVKVPSEARFVKVVAEGDGQQYKVTLGVDHSLMSTAPAWAHDIHTEDGIVKKFVLPISKFVPSKRGRRVSGLALRNEDIRYIGLALSLVDMNGEPNPHFGPGPFRIVLHEIAFE